MPGTLVFQTDRSPSEVPTRLWVHMRPAAGQRGVAASPVIFEVPANSDGAAVLADALQTLYGERVPLESLESLGEHPPGIQVAGTGLPEPEKRPQPDCCTVCAEPWAAHPPAPTILDCVELLRRRLHAVESTNRSLARSRP